MATTADREIELASLAAVEAAGEADVIDGVQPVRVARPATAEGVAAVLAWCTRHGQSVVIRGGGTRMAWGRPPGPVGVVLSMQGLAAMTRYEPGDLTVTVDAGMPMAALNRELARHGQWLPVDVPSEGATVGGTLATNESGTLRHRYGAARDQLIGVRLATADGRVAAAGGTVVKNVAGYDLGKLVTGSFGSLAAIVSASFKLAPLPPATGTMAIGFGSGEAAGASAAAIAASQLDPIGFDVESVAGRGAGAVARLLVRFGSTEASNRDQLDGVERLVAPSRPLTIERWPADDEAAMWRTRAASLWDRRGTLVRLSWLPAKLPQVLALVDEIGRSGLAVELAGRAAVGAGALVIDGDRAAEASAVERLRARSDVVGHVVIMRADVRVKARVDVWGAPPATTAVARAVKRAIDPADVLNAGRGPV
jgi:glycolate oxidase FAD binding subunit